MKASIKYIVLGIAAYSIFILMQFPINKVYPFVENVLEDKKIGLKVYGLDGSVWHGKAASLIYDGKRFDQLTWDFKPLALFTGNVALDVGYRNKDSAASGSVSQSVFGETSLKNFDAKITAPELIKMLKIPAIKLEGDLTLRLNEMSLVDKSLKYINGRLLWANAASKFPQKLVMGNLFADLTTSDDGVVKAKLGDGGGPMEVNGEATLNPDGKYDVKGALAARAGRQSALGRSLGFIGRYDSKGKANFAQTGNISELGFLIK